MFLRPAGLVFLLSCVLAFMMLNHVSGQLPERVASHFGAGGAADGWMTRGGYLRTFAWIVAGTSALFAACAWFTPRIPSGGVNLPERDYWLAPERRGQTNRRIQDYLLGMAAATNVLYLAMLQLTVVANAMAEPRLGPAFWVTMAVYMGFVLVWTVRWVLARRRP